MIVLFTDFGLNGPYLGQMQAAIYEQHTHAKVINLMADAPKCNPGSSAYLLAALHKDFPGDTVFLCVVDPEVGSRSRRPVIIQVSDQYFVGPDNGLFGILIKQAMEEKKACHSWQIVWQPEALSDSFHGRDLFAPVAAALSSHTLPHGWKQEISLPVDEKATLDLPEVIYCDHYGNVVSGLRAQSVAESSNIVAGSQQFSYARTFSEVPRGQGFWYKNSIGLVELAVNQGSACQTYQLNIGDKIHLAN